MRLFAAAESVRESAGIGLLPFAAVWQEATIERLRAELPAGEFDAEWRAGDDASPTDAVHTALLYLAAPAADGPVS